jgi:hypothetical protein
MANPPTYNDLRRRRRSGNFKLPTRIKIISGGGTRTPARTTLQFNGLDLTFNNNNLTYNG